MKWRANELVMENENKYLKSNRYINNNVYKRSTEQTPFFAETTSFSQDISRWDTSKVTDMGYMFGNSFCGSTRYSTSIKPMLRTDIDSSNDERHYNPTFEESKLLKERQWFEWREEYLEAKEIILGMVFVPNEDNIAKMRIRLKLMGNNEIYSRGIVDDEGSIHYNIRKSEIEFLMNRLQEVLDSRLEIVQTIWDKIQSAEDWYQLPVLYVGTQRNPKIPRKPEKPKGPEPRYTLM